MKERFDRGGKVIRISSDPDNNVIDISNRDELMNRMVEKDAVKFVQIGTSGNNHCLTLSKNALIAIREGKAFPIELLVAGEKIKFNIMRDTTFHKNLKAFNKLNETAKESADRTVETNKEVANLGDKIGNDSKIIT